MQNRKFFAPLFGLAAVGCALLAVVLLIVKSTPQPYIEAAMLIIAGTHLFGLAIWIDLARHFTSDIDERENDPHQVIAVFAFRKTGLDHSDVAIDNMAREMRRSPKFAKSAYEGAWEYTNPANGGHPLDFKRVIKAWQQIESSLPQPESTEPHRRDHNAGKTFIEVMVTLVVAVILIGIVLGGGNAILRDVREKQAQTQAAAREVMVVSLWQNAGYSGPESARLELARRTLITQGVDPATVTDWTPAGLVARTPPVFVPAWTSPQALALMDMPEPVVPRQ